MIGKTISHYRILEKLGEGGMGVVYKAEDLKLRRTVAIKFLPGNLSMHGEERERFTREAQSASALNHPNICTIHEIDESEGMIFIVMEYIEGRSLRSVINEGPLPIKQAAGIALCIAEGLHAAHTNGVVHRDIKPENIIVTNEGIAKIADFGLARRTEYAKEIDSKTVSGTIGYMSPEQLRGEEIDHRTDIWSLGVILYEMTTGHRPFGGEYAQAIMYAILNTSQQPVSGARADAPPSLDRIINRCLEKVALVRYQDARSIIDELRTVNVDAPVERETKSIAVLPFADISPEQDNKYFSDGLTEEIITNLSKLQTVRIISRTSVMHYERTGKTMRQIADELGVQYLLEGSVRKHGSDLRITTQLIDARQDTYLWAENYRGSMDQVFEIQENVAARIARALKVRLTPGEKRKLRQRPTENAEAYQLYLKGRFFWNKRSKDGLQKSIGYFKEAIELDAHYALAWAGIADSYNLLTEYGTASRKELYARARSAVERALELDDRLAEAHTSLAFLLMLNELDWPNSEKEFKRAIKLNPNYPTAHHWYAQWMMFNGRSGEAIREMSKAVELDPFSPAILKDKGLTLYYGRDYDGAIEYAKKTLELDPGFTISHRLLSLSYQGKKLFDEAVEANRRWGEEEGNEVEATVALAQIYAAAGRRNEAIAEMSRVSPEKLSTGNILRGIALVYAALGENDLAFTSLEKSYESRAESMCTLKVDPKLDSLRPDPRFASLLRRVGLEK